MDHISLGNRLRSAREHAGLSQQSVADKLGLQRTAVTLIEGGQRQVSTSELTHFATLYRRSIAELIDPDEKFSEDYLVVLHRLAPELQNDPLVKQDVEVCLELCRLGVDLQNALGRDSRQGPPKFSLVPPKSAAEAVSQGFEVAEEERRRLGLGSAPIRNIAARVNEQGVWAVTSRLRSDMAGFFMQHPAIGLVVIANDSHPLPRTRFSFAHEYGHVLMDRDRELQVTTTANSGDLVEKRANAFAAAFLLPASGVEHFLANLDKGRSSRQQQLVYDVASNGRFDVEARETPDSQTITYQDVALLATNYGVSFEAAVYHLNSLRYIDRPETQALLSRSSLGKQYTDLVGLRSKDASDFNHDGPELRSQIMHLAMEAYRREEISRGRLLDVGKRLNIDAHDLLTLAEADLGID
ncbi:MAG TPA: XRE family transcriptional regulator [Lacipirellulaceae bacterium]|nr:XRE family transcriptional regulator [Lacipirellulaceae bacterium]